MSVISEEALVTPNERKSLELLALCGFDVRADSKGIHGIKESELRDMVSVFERQEMLLEVIQKTTNSKYRSCWGLGREEICNCSGCVWTREADKMASQQLTEMGVK